MDRASDFGSEGWRFESVRAHQEIRFSPIELIVHHLQSKVQTKIRVLLFDLYSYVLASTRLESEFYRVGSGLGKGESGKR